jgi:hypothetical protein
MPISASRTRMSASGRPERSGQQADRRQDKA